MSSQVIKNYQCPSKANKKTNYPKIISIRQKYPYKLEKEKKKSEKLKTKNKKCCCNEPPPLAGLRWPNHPLNYYYFFSHLGVT
jgi:hypothetical protein